MDTLGKRVKIIIAYHGYNMTSFAKELKISQSMVSKICSDKATPSDRTISDICRIFNVNRDWLLRGSGEMMDTHTLQTELSELFGEHEGSTLSDAVKRNMISVLTNIPPAAWPAVTEYLKNLTEEFKNNPNGAESYVDGYRDGIRTGRKIREVIANLSEKAKE